MLHFFFSLLKEVSRCVNTFYHYSEALCESKWRMTDKKKRTLFYFSFEQLKARAYKIRSEDDNIKQHGRYMLPVKQCKSPPCRIYHIQTLAEEQVESSQSAKFQSHYMLLRINARNVDTSTQV